MFCVPRSRWIGLGLAVAVGAAIAAFPSPHRSVLAITGFTVTLWMFQVMNNGIASILMMAAMILAGIRPSLALGGFSSPQFWVLFSVLFLGFAMQRTGLARRISFFILARFPATYPGILAAFLVIGLVLALGIPSMTVRTAIVVPIAWALVQSLGLAPQSRGTALVMLTAVEMAVVPGCAFLYGSLYGPVVASVFQAKNFELSWLGYAAVMTLPTLLFCVLLVVANQMVLKPEAPLSVSSAFARDELKAMGKMHPNELVTAIVVCLSIAYWATDRLHHLPSFLVGMLAMGVFGMAGIIEDKDISGGVSWTLMLFLGGIFSLQGVVQEYKIADWFAGFVVPLAERFTFSVALFVVAMAAVMFLLRFVDPTGFIALPVMFLPVAGLAGSAGIPPLVLVAPLLLAGAPFWAVYQNIWIAMGEGMTSGQAWTPVQRLRLAHTYAAACLITLAASVAYWKLIGVLK